MIYISREYSTSWESSQSFFPFWGKKKESQGETQWRDQEQEIEHRHLAAAKPSKHLTVQVPACLRMDVPTCSQALCGHFGVLPCSVLYELDPVDTLEDSPCTRSGFRFPHNVQETAFNEWWEEGHSSVPPFPVAHHWPGTQQGRTSKQSEQRCPSWEVSRISVICPQALSNC